MVFSSPTFLFLFLPAVLLLNLAVPARHRNALLLLASLLFYAWGELGFVWVIGASIGFNYAAGRAIAGSARPAVRRGALALAVLGNLGLLGWFKYAGFAAANWNAVAGAVGLPDWPLEPRHLPLGISFFTFQALSYVIDVQRGRADAQPRPVRLALFVALFPQLIAGPIVRYTAIAGQIARRSLGLGDFAAGARRFTVGLGKKVLVANTLAVPADRIFALSAGEIGTGVAWFGLACYALQIYFDFSGYSDMAIGLGRMLGFRLPENFDYPYAATSIRDFWRRWHITLSRWFRDYLYIPLGGNRGGSARTHRNLLLVFLLCGLWHGASWNFAFWGLFHGSFLVLERSRLRELLPPQPRVVARIYTVLVVAIGWVFFRADDLPHAFDFLGVLIGARGVPAYVVDHATPETLAVFAAALLGSSPWWRRLAFPAAAEAVAIAGVLIACAAKLAVGTYDPFIYFRF